MAAIHGPATLRFLGVLAFTVVWLGLVYSVPDVGAVTNRVGVFRIAIHLVILAGLWFALEHTAFEPDVRLRVWLLIAIPLTLWLAGIWTLAVQGAFIPAPEISRVPALPIAILFPPLIALFLLLRSKRVAALLDATPAAWLVGLQVYRVLGGIFLVNWARGLMPREFALPAGSGDVLVGLLALPAALYVASGTRTGRRIGIAWNVLGLLDFTVAIGMGMMTAPGPLQVIVPERANSLVGTYPTVMIPAFSVPSGIVLHVLSIWQLVRLGRRAQATAAAPMPALQPTR